MSQQVSLTPGRLTVWRAEVSPPDCAVGGILFGRFGPGHDVYVLTDRENAAHVRELLQERQDEVPYVLGRGEEAKPLSLK